MSVIRRLLREPLRARAWKELAYALIGAPLAIVGFVLLFVSVFAGGVLSITFIGLPIIATALLCAQQFGGVHRTLARWLLGVRVDRPELAPPAPGLFGWIRSRLGNVAGWRAMAYLFLKVPLAVATLMLAGGFWIYGTLFTAYPVLFYTGLMSIDVDSRGVRHRALMLWNEYYLDTWPRTWGVAVVIGVPLLLCAPWVTRTVVGVDAWLIRALLSPTATARRLSDLTMTRAQAVDDSAAKLRQIERDLHDGAQAKLVALAMKLGLAREELDGSDPVALERARTLVETAHVSAKEAIAELRDLARGIHPPVLDNGLDAALATLAAHSAVPVRLRVDVPDRPSPAIETIVYFCAAELLTNVAKHSAARQATVSVAQRAGLLRLVVEDDGTGGAAIGTGTGLAGLADRVRTVDGRLMITSPPGGPTAVTVELPSHT